MSDYINADLYNYLQSNPSYTSEGTAADLSQPQKADYSDLVKGGASAMSRGSSLGGAVTGAGLYGMMSSSPAAAAAGPYALAGGLAISALEENAKAKAAEEDARVKEAEARKQATQNAINQMIAATSRIGV